MLSFASTIAVADYRSDIGYTRLQLELGGSIPAGTGVVVSQVEGNIQVNGQNAWMPLISDASFVGKTFTNASNAPPGLYSSHATAVGYKFYGVATSIAPGIANIAVYSADDWLGPAGFLQTVNGSGGSRPKISTSRIANHSWVGTVGTADTYVLRRMDWLVETDEFIQVVGVNNGTGGNSAWTLMAGAYNVMAVGRSDGGNDLGSVAVDSTYTAGRARPHIVDPANITSIATPGISAAVALLVQTGHDNPALSTDPVSVSMTNRAGTLVRNAERSEVIKAALMAGADRTTHNSAPNPTNLAPYRGTVLDQTANGLDRRYGAGQLNIRNSYWIIAGGEQNSTEDGNTGANVASRGFDYDPHFGGATYSGGTGNTTATYPLPIQTHPSLLTVSLVWNLDITGGTNVNNFYPTATFRDLNLALIDLDNGGAVVANSASTVENTENLWVVVPANARYALKVTRPVPTTLWDWDYGLAWQLLQDTDADGVYDDEDNCINVANSDQLDSDGDGYGNHCDGDLNNDGATNAFDSPLFREQLGQPSVPPTYNVADINTDGAVNAFDTPLYRQLLGAPPGPSGLVP